MNKNGIATVFVVLLTAVVTAMICYICFVIWMDYNIIENGEDFVKEKTSVISGSSSDKMLPSNIQNKIYNLKKIIDTDYLYEYDEDEMADLMAAGMLEALDDPYAQYYNKDAFDSFYMQTQGEYFGIGVYVTYDDSRKMPIVIVPIENSPAEEAGLQTADYIEYVDDLKASEATYSEMVDAIKGLPGTKVRIGIIRQKDDESKEEEHIEKIVERRRIEINPIKTDIYQDDIGYIRLTSFDDVTEINFKEAYKEITNNPNIKSLIIDLRDNPGGVLSVCTAITDLIVPEGKIVYTIDKAGNEVATYSDSKKIEIPLVVLVNNNSASASEVFTAAIKDYKMGTIVGEKTYGKGVVQTLKALKDGTYIKLTTSEYFSPNGNKIDKQGVTPDVEVKLPEDIKSTYNLEFEKDTQLQKAIEILKEAH